ncbi:MAG TPA: hypothetical protein DCR43_02145 [Bacteroidales bacterium]|nr:MAG: hypothetical protein A2X11_11995 [Bacteroidetes bacterium GWE2_42_24]OFY31058.1 MAG: hypothetical protein A2X09_15950 [Bacteroidetes bacterium GWF2_43_11]HAQ64650.1 hypothetical protein [Bacteroidales bacterium]HBZ66570.1 hypothetical protein [Bacteroidales bacterium]
MIIIGITGTLGAGKGTIVEYLVGKRQFVHYSVRAFLTEEIEQRNLPVNRDTMTMLANELRAAHSPSYVTDQLLIRARQCNHHCIIESIRTPGEITSLRRCAQFVLFAVDGDPAIRYERIIRRGSATDSISFETFLSNEQREMQSTDPNHQNLAECIRQADYTFSNNGTLEELHRNIEEVLIHLNI